MNFKKYFLNFDYILFFTTVILTIIGILFIFSANSNKTPDKQSEFIKQIIFACISLALLFGILFVSNKDIVNISIIFYILCLIGLIITLFFPSIKGQKRFILPFFSFSLQFSEFMKIAVILFLSYYYSNKSISDLRKLNVYLKGILIVLIPVILILLQPDLGTILVYIPILFSISFIAGIKKRYIFYSLLLILFISLIPLVTSLNNLFFNNENQILNLFTNKSYVIIVFIILAITLCLSVLSFQFLKDINKKIKKIFYIYIFIASSIFFGLLISYPLNFKILKSYQKDRLMIFFNPDFDPKDKGYNIIQSKTAIGNGGLFGKGWCKGEQIQNFFLPEQANDFIYPVIAEEWGFFRSLFIFFLFLFLFYRGLMIIFNTRNYLESYAVIGILTMYLFHIVQNIGMCLGIMPITGIPLPFLSYGGSFLTTCYLGIGIMMNIHLNRHQF